MSGLSVFESMIEESLERKMKKLLLTAIVGALACSTAMAERWYLFNTDKEEVTYADLSSIECNGGICSIWLGQVNIDKTKKYDSVMAYYDVKCKSKKYRHPYIALYLKGKVIESESFKNAEYSPIIPGSIGQRMLNLACGKEDIQDDLIMEKNFLAEVPKLQKHMRSEVFQNAFK